MFDLKSELMQLLRQEDAVTSIEYALVAALIVLAIVVAVGVLGTTVQTLYEDVADQVVAAIG